MTRVKGQQPETKIRSALDNQTIASALGSDTNGNDLDQDTDQWPRSVKFVTDAVDLSDGSDDLQFKIQDAADDGTGSPDTWEDTSKSTFNVANGAEHSVDEYDLSDLRRHVRVVLDSSNSTLAADTEVSVEAVLSGMKVVPQS